MNTNLYSADLVLARTTGGNYLIKNIPITLQSAESLIKSGKLDNIVKNYINKFDIKNIKVNTETKTYDLRALMFKKKLGL